MPPDDERISDSRAGISRLHVDMPARSQARGWQYYRESGETNVYGTAADWSLAKVVMPPPAITTGVRFEHL